MFGQAICGSAAPAIAALMVSAASTEAQRHPAGGRAQAIWTDTEESRPVVCSKGQFPFRAFSAPPAAEQGEDGASVALRRVLAGGTGVPSQPNDGSILRPRLREPQVRVLSDAMVITFVADQLEGFQACPTHPEVRRTVRLPEPLGERQLLDGATVPSQPPCLRLGVYDCKV